MEKKEVLQLFRRIESHYPTFVHDNYKEFEWCRELKHYDYDDVNEKLEAHMKNEQYGSFEPKLFFLTKYLKTTSQKVESANRQIMVCCNLCQNSMTIDEFDNHYGRCLTERATLKLLNNAGQNARLEDINYLSNTKLDALYEKYKPAEQSFYGITGGN